MVRDTLRMRVLVRADDVGNLEHCAIRFFWTVIPVLIGVLATRKNTTKTTGFHHNRVDQAGQ